MKQSNKPTKHLELETYNHKGVGVTVEINYDAGTISLLEKGQPKKWIFAGRQVEYMPGWLNILDAMKYAIEEATLKLEAHQKEKEKQLKEKEIGLMKAIGEMGPLDIRPKNDPYAQHREPDRNAPYQNINRKKK